MAPLWCWRVPMTLNGRSIAPVIAANSYEEARARAEALGEDILGVKYERTFEGQEVLITVSEPIFLHHTVRWHRRHSGRRR